MAKRRLKTIKDLRRYLANLINRTDAGEVEATLSGKLGYLTGILLKAIEGSDIEKRVGALEKELNPKK